MLGRITEKSVELDAAFHVPDADATRPGRVRALLSLMLGGFLSSMVLADRPDEAVADAATQRDGLARVTTVARRSRITRIAASSPLRLAKRHARPSEPRNDERREPDDHDDAC